MKDHDLNYFKDQLLQMRRRVAGDLERVEQSIREDINPAGKVSGLPVHLADAAEESIDADLPVLATERNILKEIDGALERIGRGTFGTCETCGSKIARERLEAIPYASQCIRCAGKPRDKPETR